MEKETRGISRRSFLKAGAVAGGMLGAGSLIACNASASEGDASTADATWDRETDVIIVGFGGAGGAAALEAHDAGAEVLILEKTATPGGCTVCCAGIYYGAGTALQKAAGIDDNADDMYNYLNVMAKGYNNKDLTRQEADLSAETYDWLVSLGSEFYEGVNLYGGIPPIKPLADDDTSYGLYYSGAEYNVEPSKAAPPVPRGHIVKSQEPTFAYPPINPGIAPTEDAPTRGTGFFVPLWNGVQSRGIEVLLETRAMTLVKDPETGAVIGIEALQATIPTEDITQLTDYTDATPLRIKARKAVILTAGGYSQNKEFQQIYCKLGVAAQGYNKADTGDGIIMGMEAGAGPINLPRINLSVSGMNRGCILVNKGARRFTDETHYGFAGWAWVEQQDSTAWEIGDSVILGTKEADYIATTLEDLAAQIGLDVETLISTVNYYNESVALGIDREWGKTRITNHGNMAEGGELKAISTPPFYANLKTPEMLTGQGLSMGGLRINTDAQVLKSCTTEAIPRLYAAGSNSGGIMGKMYPGSGSCIAQAMIYGRIAGKKAAAETSL